jgi:hypothetical protein
MAVRFDVMAPHMIGGNRRNTSHHSTNRAKFETIFRVSGETPWSWTSGAAAASWSGLAAGRGAEAAGIDAAMSPLTTRQLPVPYEAPDLATLVRAIVRGSGVGDTVARHGEARVAGAIAEAARPHRRPDGGYRFENTFLLLVAEPGPA